VNFTFTWKKGWLFIGALVLAGIVGAAFNSELTALAILIAAVAWIAQMPDEKPKPKPPPPDTGNPTL